VGGKDVVPAAAPHQLGQTALSELVRGDLRAEVTATHPWRAGIGQDELEHVVDVAAAPDEADGRDDQPFGPDVTGPGGVGSWLRCAHGGGGGPGHAQPPTA